MSLRNLSETKAENLNSIVEIKPHQVVSMALSKNENANVTLLAFADGEDLSEEVYPQDTLYFVIEGSMTVVSKEDSIPVSAGQVIKVPAGKPHRLSAQKSFKIMQISI